ncbi:hypothetical protein IW261DRAFT_1428652 [Armillaria novae-zelandiae]|uniref:Uncharacterized protein n=1 Tax=Armillaria novae-zelandiae TaxID=153914 RepID=A0AA39TVI5_9AGAR|nr:hypothetical protein IW261DRAFT_1428652 [Armillaria novae-zelandiae]
MASIFSVDLEHIRALVVDELDHMRIDQAEHQDRLPSGSEEVEFRDRSFQLGTVYRCKEESAGLRRYQESVHRSLSSPEHGMRIPVHTPALDSEHQMTIEDSQTRTLQPPPSLRVNAQPALLPTICLLGAKSVTSFTYLARRRLFARGLFEEARMMADDEEVREEGHVARIDGVRPGSFSERSMILELGRCEDISWEGVWGKPGVITTYLEDNSKKVVIKNEARTSLSNKRFLEMITSIDDMASAATSADADLEVEIHHYPQYSYRWIRGSNRAMP